MNLIYELDVEPYKMNLDWLDINESTGCSKQTIKWNDPKGENFPKNHINLSSFLPSNVKMEEWIENFCTAFNLDLKQVTENEFSLDLKNNLGGYLPNILDLDVKTNVDFSRENSDLGMPSSYDLGFKVDKEEYGFLKDQKKTDGKFVGGEDGGGKFETGNISGKKIGKPSNFSYTWMMEMKDKNNGKPPIFFPIISEKEVWKNSEETYDELTQKRYTDKAQRFWYKTGNEYALKMSNGKFVDAAQVSNELTLKNGQRFVLNYKNEPDSILRNFFTVFIDDNAHYTTVECHLSPDEYANIDTCMAKFNGDLYYIAEVDAYDPMGTKKAKMKLIKANA